MPRKTPRPHPSRDLFFVVLRRAEELGVKDLSLHRIRKLCWKLGRRQLFPGNTLGWALELGWVPYKRKHKQRFRQAAWWPGGAGWPQGAAWAAYYRGIGEPPVDEVPPGPGEKGYVGRAPPRDGA